jgi:hypothetical protein
MAHLEESNRKTDEAYALLASQVTPLRNAVEELKGLVHKQLNQIEALLDTVKQKDRELEKQSLIKHELDQLKRLL